MTSIGEALVGQLAATVSSALGYAIPAAIGAALANPDAPIVFIVWNNRGYREIMAMADDGPAPAPCPSCPASRNRARSPGSCRRLPRHADRWSSRSTRPRSGRISESRYRLRIRHRRSLNSLDGYGFGEPQAIHQLHAPLLKFQCLVTLTGGGRRLAKNCYRLRPCV